MALANYNIPSNNRELQPDGKDRGGFPYYNIPSNNRELQPTKHKEQPTDNYNIPSNNRELQHTLSDAINLFIITYQVITGNYSQRFPLAGVRFIITYQVITGNYSLFR